MAQLNLYLPKALEKRVRSEAKRREVSLSQYVASILEEKTTGGPGWSESFFDDVAGSWKGAVPEIEDLKQEKRTRL